MSRPEWVINGLRAEELDEDMLALTGSLRMREPVGIAAWRLRELEDALEIPGLHARLVGLARIEARSAGRELPVEAARAAAQAVLVMWVTGEPIEDPSADELWIAAELERGWREADAAIRNRLEGEV